MGLKRGHDRSQEVMGGEPELFKVNAQRRLRQRRVLQLMRLGKPTLLDGVHEVPL